jgi:hypothetical protein
MVRKAAEDRVRTLRGLTPVTPTAYTFAISARGLVHLALRQSDGQAARGTFNVLCTGEACTLNYTRLPQDTLVTCLQCIAQVGR